MMSEINQIELTDQELETVLGGWGIGAGSVGTFSNVGGAFGGASTGGLSTGVGAGSTGGVGIASGSSTGIKATSPTGTITGVNSTGSAAGAGY